MSAPEGNQFWKLRSKHGRNKIFEDVDIFREAIYEYFETTHNRTINEQHWVGKDGDEVAKRHPVPFTLQGLCNFLDISTDTWRNYKTAMSKDFLEVITRVEDIIYQNKFEGAVTGFFNANIIARDLGLADKKEHSGSIDLKQITGMEIK